MENAEAECSNVEAECPNVEAARLNVEMTSQIPSPGLPAQLCKSRDK